MGLMGPNTMTSFQILNCQNLLDNFLISDIKEVCSSFHLKTSIFFTQFLGHVMFGAVLRSHQSSDFDWKSSVIEPESALIVSLRDA